MIAHGDAHILLSGVESRLLAAVARQDIVLTEHVDDNLSGRIRWQHLTEEIIGLRGHYTEEGHRAQMLFKAVALCQELIASLQVVALVLVVDLHEELGKRVEVPDGYLFLDPRNQVCIGRGEDAETAAKKAAEDAEAQKRQQADLEERQRFDAHILSSFGNDQARAQKFTSQLQYAAQNGLGTILDNAPGTWDFLSRDPNGPKVFEKVLNDKAYFQRMFLNNRTDLGMLVTAREIARELAGTPTPTPTPAPAPTPAKPGVVPNIGKPGAGGNGAAPDIFSDDSALKKFIRDHS